MSLFKRFISNLSESIRVYTSFGAVLHSSFFHFLQNKNPKDMTVSLQNLVNDALYWHWTWERLQRQIFQNSICLCYFFLLMIVWWRQIESLIRNFDYYMSKEKRTVTDHSFKPYFSTNTTFKNPLKDSISYPVKVDF